MEHLMLQVSHVSLTPVVTLYEWHLPPLTESVVSSGASLALNPAMQVLEYNLQSSSVFPHI